VTIEEVESVDHLVGNLENIESPSQLVAGLHDPVLQKYLMLNASTDSSRRLDFWLQRSFEDELETLREGFGLSPTLSELLSGIVSYTESTKVFYRSSIYFLV
jgi:centromere protein I